VKPGPPVDRERRPSAVDERAPDVDRGIAQAAVELLLVEWYALVRIWESL
jgi:hypothetical protein